MKSLNKTESPIFLLLCVPVSKGKLLEFYLHISRSCEVFCIQFLFCSGDFKMITQHLDSEPLLFKKTTTTTTTTKNKTKKTQKTTTTENKNNNNKKKQQQKKQKKKKKKKTTTKKTTATTTKKTKKKKKNQNDHGFKPDIFGLRHTKTCLRAYADSVGLDQPDQGPHCPLTESLDTTQNVWLESKGPDDTLRMHKMNLILCLLRMFEHIFSLGVPHLYISSMLFRCRC